MSIRRVLGQVSAVVQYALVGILFLAIVAFWAIVTQENGSKNLVGITATWEEVVAAQPAQSNDGGRR